MIDIIKSPHDQLEYLYLKLSNEINVILINNEDTESSAVALRVETGSYQDPENHQGMAHFLEHLLFMGSSKYPNVDHYSDFITKNGGSYNAFTEDAATTYYHEIRNEVI